MIVIRAGGRREDLGSEIVTCNLFDYAGMDPQKIGNSRVDEPHDNTDEETCMIYQEFLLDPSLSVQELLEGAQAEVVDFARFEVGEELDESTLEPTLENVQTCG